MDYQYLLERVVKTYEELVSNTSRAEIKRRNKAGEFHYIPLSPHAFTKQLEAVSTILQYGHRGKMPPTKFVDVGCGIGTKVLLATMMGFDAYGIEKNIRYCKAAAKLLRQNEYGGRDVKERIFNANALSYSYHDFDVIYFYCPLYDRKLQAKLEERIIETAKSGALILANNFQSDTLTKSDCCQVAGDEYPIFEIVK